MTIVKFQRGITPKMNREKLQFLWSTPRLMKLLISMKYHDTIWNDFQVIERT